MADLSAPPPSRYRVVERGRTLVVVDTVTGHPVEQRASPTPSALGGSGTAELATRALYDDKGPRTILLDPHGAAVVGRIRLFALFVACLLVIVAITNAWYLLPIAFFIGNDRLRKHVRAAVTRALDRLERG